MHALPPAPVGARGHGLYVHVPFCARTCDFCAFYQVRPEGDDIARYLAAVGTELALLPGRQAWHTAFWGGGTPGLLTPPSLERLGRLVLEHALSPPVEWTVELAPTTVRADRLQALRSLGVTRVSLGVQSFQPRLLEGLGRPHAVEQVRRAWDLINAAGFASRNLDLIFGIPGQSLADWRADLAEAIRMQPDHLSTYCLTLEEDTALYLRLSRGAGRVPLDHEESLMLQAAEDLGAAGFDHYEVSNHARPGHVCIHNLTTWRMGTWDGIGPSAASQQTASRGSNPADLEAWSRDLAAGRRATCDRRTLTPADLAVDRLVFGLRTAEGVAWDEVAAPLGPAAPTVEALLASWVGDGLLRHGHGRWQPTLRGFLVADALGTEILAAAESPCLAPGSGDTAPP
jgi:oxygen-independent coproporphyrinogen-3 oxidase